MLSFVKDELVETALTVGRPGVDTQAVPPIQQIHAHQGYNFADPPVLPTNAHQGMQQGQAVPNTATLVVRIHFDCLLAHCFSPVKPFEAQGLL